MAKKPKKPKKPVKKKIEPLDLNKAQKIKLTKDNFELLLNFCTGKFPECFGLPEQMEAVIPPRCPACRFGGGYDYTNDQTKQGFARHCRHNDVLRINRVVRVRCLSCGQLYMATESWSINYELA